MASTTKSYPMIVCEYKEEQKVLWCQWNWLQGKQRTSFKDNGSDEINFFEATKLTKT